MNILVIIIICNIFAIACEISRLVISILLGFKPTEVGILAGPKLFSFRIKELTISLRMFPLGSFVTFDNENYLINNKIKRIIISYYGNIIEVAAFLVINEYFNDNYILKKVGIVIAVGFIIDFISATKNIIKANKYLEKTDVEVY